MLFSVVIPVYNVEKYLPLCLESILPQIKDLKEPCEVLLIDDGSTDISGEICDKYKSMYPKLIRVFHNKNQGLLLTRRYGYSKAKGQYIINCDSDDTLEKQALLKMKQTILSFNKPDIILFNYNYQNGITKRVAYENIFTTKDYILLDKKSVLIEYLKTHSVVSLCTKICKRSCYDLNKDYSQFSKVTNGEDTLQSLELYNNANSFVYLNKSLYNYRIGSGMTRKFDCNYYFGFKKIFQVIAEQNKIWDLNGFCTLFSIKVLQTVGRSITQSRYNIWKSNTENKEYLMNLYDDDMVNEALRYLYDNRRNLQKSHILFLSLLKKREFNLICFLLSMKNTVEKWFRF